MRARRAFFWLRSSFVAGLQVVLVPCGTIRSLKITLREKPYMRRRSVTIAGVETVLVFGKGRCESPQPIAG